MKIEKLKEVKWNINIYEPARVRLKSNILTFPYFSEAKKKCDGKGKRDEKKERVFT